MTTQEVTIIKRKVQPLVAKAESITIASSEDMQEAVQVLSQLNTIHDKIEEEKGRVLDPILAAAKAERSRWKPLETMYDTAITAIRNKMSVYQTAEARRVKEEEAKIAARAAKGTIKLETAVRKTEAVVRPDTKVISDAGLVKFREKQTVVITDATLIPREYLVIDDAAVLTALKAGVAVPGAVMELVQVPVNFR